MKKKLKLLALIPVLLLSTSCDFLDKILGKNKEEETQMNSVNVIIISGQSNAVGCKASENLIKSMGQAKYDEYNAGYENIKIAYSNWTVDYNSPARPVTLQNSSTGGDFVKVKLGYGNNTKNFGPEVGIAEELHERWGDKLYIIKCGCGGSNLNDDWADTNEFMHKQLIEYVSARMEALKRKGLNPYLRAFCWIQGEGDSYPNYWPYYYDNMVRFKESIDKKLLQYTENNVLPFVDAGIGRGTHPDTGKDEWVYYKEVNDSKKDFAKLSPSYVYFDTIEAGLHSNQEDPDDVHYDSDSQIQLGHLCAQNLEQFLK